MKKVVPDAYKGSVSCYTFFHPHATKILKTYISQAERSVGKFAEDAPLFLGERVDDTFSPVNLRTLERMAKDAARKAGIDEWKAVHPHCIGKAFQKWTL